MISKTAEYAIRAALWLAGHPGQSWSVHHIAGETDIPAKYLAKVMQALGRAGLVKAQPGPGGGFLLARRPPQIGLLDIFTAADPIRRIRSCPLDDPTHADGLCPLHSRLDRALATIEEAFRGCTLADLLAESNDFDQTCASNTRAVRENLRVDTARSASNPAVSADADQPLRLPPTSKGDSQ
ncbi:iron-responsive transcriptional regulator [Phycisphaerae bacterium RAS1]|nr:iron-responsive transcriptional regulator [Phycisphaerae bacterium RAS1]